MHVLNLDRKSGFFFCRSHWDWVCLQLSMRIYKAGGVSCPAAKRGGHQGSAWMIYTAFLSLGSFFPLSACLFLQLRKRYRIRERFCV